jgi:ubiquinone/menaquinone biosynthesis C-methylase UbiE
MDSNEISHNEVIVSQFTRQAIPFAQMSQHSNQHGLDLMLKLSEPKKDDTVLDVACGPGIVACGFAPKVSHVTGIDITPAMIEQAKFLQKKLKLENVDWRVGDVSRLPFDDRTFSMVVTRYSLHHVVDPKKVLEEMKRVCLPGGRILAVDVTPDPHKKELYNYVEKLRDPSHTEALAFHELKNMVEDVGFVDIRSERHDLEMGLETIMKASFPNPENKDKMRRIFKEDLTRNNLGVRSHLRDGQIYFYFPISIIVGSKTT